MSAQAISILNLSFKAAGDVLYGRGVGFDGAQATVKGQKVMGVAAVAVKDGRMADFAAIGTAVVEAGAAFAVGASLIMDVQGRAIVVTGALAVKAGATAVTSTAANGATVLSGADLPEYVFADAMQAAGGVGELVEVFLRR